MLLRLYLGILTACAVLGAAGLAAVATRLDPFGSSAGQAIVLFHAALLPLVFGVVGVVLFFLRAWWASGGIHGGHVIAMLRYSILASIVVVGQLYMVATGLFTWYLGVLLVAAAIAIELLLALLW